jgi:pSer/pThr/pTyr-binding forkhead associated (FHA) protein
VDGGLDDAGKAEAMSSQSPDGLFGIVVEVDVGARFRVGEDGLLSFRVRNLTQDGGRVTMLLRVGRVAPETGEQSVFLRPGGIHDLKFPLTSETPGEKLVESLDVRLDLGGAQHRMVLPDHSLTFRMAAHEGQAGQIDLRGATFDFREIVGDVSIRELIRQQDREAPARPEERWRTLALSPRPLDGQALLQSPRALGVRDLVLIGEARPGAPERRFFLFARKELVFGVNPAAGEDGVQLALRRLPCRSAELDPESWRLNDRISRVHGRLALRDDLLQLMDQSTNGTVVNARRAPKGQWTPLSRTFRLGLTAEQPVLTLAGRVTYPERQARGLALGWPSSEPPGESREVGAEHALPLDAVCLERQDNLREHTYVQVFRGASVGAGKGCALRLEGEGVEPRHADVVFYQDEWFVRSASPKARTEVNGRRVGPEDFVSLAPGKTLTLGEVDLLVRPLDPREMMFP